MKIGDLAQQPVVCIPMLLPSSNTVLALVTNDGAIEAADRAFVELAEDLSTLVEAQRNGG